jgi:hypothetical protein
MHRKHFTLREDVGQITWPRILTEWHINQKALHLYTEYYHNSFALRRNFHASGSLLKCIIATMSNVSFLI